MKDNIRLNWHDWVWRLWFYIKTRRQHRETIKELNKLTDKELNDIGISRSDIDRLIWLEYDKSMRARGRDASEQKR